MRRLLDKEDFYIKYRPLLAAFWPEEIILRGVGKGDGLSVKIVQPTVPCWDGPQGLEVKAKGPSAGQSTMIVLFDTLLGISHRGEAGEFQQEMLGYMPREHRAMAMDFIGNIERSGSVKALIRRGDARKEVQEAFQDCVKAFSKFRQFHLGVAKNYLSGTTKGTGTSTFAVLLKDIADNTSKALSESVSAF